MWIANWVTNRVMGTGADFPITRIATEDMPVAERIATVREAYAIAAVEITPHAASPFYWRGAVRKLPGLALASAAVSGVRVARAAADAGDDFIFTVAVEGRVTLQQGGRETVLRAGDIAVTRAREPATLDCAPESRWIELGVPAHALAATIDDGDAFLVTAISAPEPRSMLLRYVDVLLASAGLERPETLRLAVAHVHEIVALVLLAARKGVATDSSRRPGAARLRAIKADIVENACSRDLTIASLAERHRVTPRYVRKLFEGENTTFTEFVLLQRLVRARRMLADPRSAAETISAIAFACGFGDLSYFNRAFRRHYGATPSVVREAARRGGGSGVGGDGTNVADEAGDCAAGR